MTKRENIKEKYSHAMKHLSLLKREKQDSMMAVFDFLDYINQEKDKDWIREMFRTMHMIIAQTEKILIAKYITITDLRE